LIINTLDVRKTYRRLLPVGANPEPPERDFNPVREREGEQGREEDGTTMSWPRAVKSAARDADHACESSRIANVPDVTSDPRRARLINKF